MMGCHALGEDADDDDRKFLAAAQEDATLVANLLLSLSRSQACAPWRHHREPTSPPSSPSTGAEDASALPDPPKWGLRRKRSRCAATEGLLAAAKEDAWRSSPTTPLSWSGGSWTSGSVCESTPPHPSKRRRRRRPEGAACHGDEPGLRQPAKGPKAEPYEKRVLVAAEPAAIGSLSGSGSSKQAAAVRVPPKPVAHIEPLRLRLTGDGPNPAVVRRPAKKKTVPELKALKESLLQEQVELRMELEEQRRLYAALREENVKLKSLEQSSSAVRTAGEPTATSVVRGAAEESEEPPQLQTVKGENNAKADRPEQVPCTSRSTSVAPPQRAPLFDLNCPPDDNLLL